VSAIPATTVVGRVVSQSSRTEFRFERVTADGAGLAPGDLVELHLNSGPTVVVLIESMEGHLLASGTGQYSYRCRLLDKPVDADLVGVSVHQCEETSVRRTAAPERELSGSVGEVATRSEHIDVSIELRSVLSTHSCLFGGSGSGKSTLLGLVLEEILRQTASSQIIVLDPNSDFAHIDEPLTLAAVNLPTNACLPLTPDTATTTQKAVAARRHAFYGKPTLSLERLSALHILEATGRPIRPDDEIAMRTLCDLLRRNDAFQPATCVQVLSSSGVGTTSIDSLSAEFRNRLSDVLPEATIQRRAIGSLLDTFSAIQASTFWSHAKADSLSSLLDTTEHRPEYLQLDLGNLPFLDRSVFAAKALEALWDRNQQVRIPTLIVVDEAHNLCTPNPSNCWQERTTEWINRIAAEGRKYSLSLLIASQRPAKIHPNTLDNCRNTFVLRLQNRDDLATLERNTLDVSKELLQTMPTIPRFHALIYGECSRPILIRVGRRRMA
jgi:hypothetical protein